MATARTEEVEGQDDEFLFHLNRGAELLTRGEPSPARASLVRALELRPKDPKALGLLGQAFYKLGRYDEAVEAYTRLVNESPVEVPARVNLGLANLKAKRHPEAVQQLQTVLDLSPGHKKAMGYLGLAHLETGDYATARAWFERAGSDQMVARCDELLGQVQRRTAPEPPAAAPPPPAEETPAPVAATPPPEAEPPPPAAEDPAAGPRADGPSATPLLTPEGAVSPAPAEVPVPVPQPPAPPLAAPSGPPLPPPGPSATPAFLALVHGGAGGATATLAQLLEARLVVPAAVEPFAVSRGMLTVAVRGEILARARGIVAVRGTVRIAPEVKRFRGKATDKPFGEGPDRMLRASGEGALLYRAGTHRLTAVELAGESTYLREEALFGFEEALAFENGRVASRLGADLNLVHLRGRGRLLLATAGDPVALAVSADAPLRVPLAVLAGWSGSLTPRVVALHEGGDPTDASAQPVVELTGDGRVLVDPEAAPRAASQG